MLMLTVFNSESKPVEFTFNAMEDAMGAISSIEKAFNVKSYRLEMQDGYGIMPILSN